MTTRPKPAAECRRCALRRGTAVCRFASYKTVSLITVATVPELRAGRVERPEAEGEALCPHLRARRWLVEAALALQLPPRLLEPR